MEDRKDQLYTMLYDVLNELTEYDTADNIFDGIVDEFAFMAEYHSGQADVFTDMLNTFRHNNPVETIPDDPVVNVDNPLPPEELYGGINDINKAYLLEDRDNLFDFIKNLNFPTIDS